MTTYSVTRDHLNDITEFDVPFRVTADRKVITGEDACKVPTADGSMWVYAPEVYNGELDDDRWTLLAGHSGQHGYHGPIMHPSETLSGGLADAVLSTPGLYVVVADVVMHEIVTSALGGQRYCKSCGHGGCDDTDDGEATGWAVARYTADHTTTYTDDL